MRTFCDVRTCDHIYHMHLLGDDFSHVLLFTLIDILLLHPPSTNPPTATQGFCADAHGLNNEMFVVGGDTVGGTNQFTHQPTHPATLSLIHI